MTTRREVLSAAALGSLAGLLAACEQQPEAVQPGSTGDRLLVAHRDGLGIFDSGTNKWLAAPKAATASGARLFSLEGETLLVREADTAQVSGQSPLPGLWTPRAANHNQVALVAGSHGAADIYRPEPRVSTSLLIMRDGKERKRFTLDGNLEPEAFSGDGDRLFLLDYLPPQAPNVYRVRSLNLETGQLEALQTRTKTLVPPGAEEVMRGQGRHAVHDTARGILFTLYTHLGDHQHTGELLGVRPGAPNVHSFIHALHLQDGWAFCIDLPAPFGTGPAEGHTIALSTNNMQLYAIAAQHGAMAVIDPDALNVMRVQQFAPATGAAFALGLPQESFLIGAGSRLAMLEGARWQEWKLDFDLRGLALGGQLWAGRDGGVSALDLRNRKESDRLEIPGLTSLSRAFARR